MNTSKMSTKLPIFIISGKSPISAGGGGYSTYAYNLARVIKDLEFPLYVLSLGKESEQVDTEVGKILSFKVTIPFLNVSVYALPGLPIYSLIFAREIKRIV